MKKLQFWIYNDYSSERKIIGDDHSELNALWKCNSVVFNPEDKSDWDIDLIKFVLKDETIKREEGNFFPRNIYNAEFHYVVGNDEVSFDKWKENVCSRIIPLPRYSDYNEIDMINQCLTEEETNHPVTIVGKIPEKNEWKRQIKK